MSDDALRRLYALKCRKCPLTSEFSSPSCIEFIRTICKEFKIFFEKKIDSILYFNFDIIIFLRLEKNKIFTLLKFIYKYPRYKLHFSSTLLIMTSVQ